MDDLFRKEVMQHGAQRLQGTVILSSPLSVRLFGSLLAATIFLALLFASLASYARRETVVGVLIPDQGLFRAVAEEAGRVVSLPAVEGGQVEAGAEIATLRVSPEIAEGDAGQAVLAELSAELQATRAGADAEAARRTLEERHLRSRRENLLADRREAQLQIELQETRVELMRDELERLRSLADRGFFPRVQVDAREAAVLEGEQRLASLRQNKLRLDRELVEVVGTLAVSPIEASAQEATSAASYARLEQRRAEVQSRSGYVVRSMTGGTVAAVPARLGQHMQSGATIAVIVPRGSNLEAELYVPSRAAGFVRPGQEVRLQYDAFPHQRFGARRGEVIAVSRTVLAPSEIGYAGVNVDEPVFRVRVRLTQQYVEAYRQRMQLQAGMTLSADVIIDRRTLFEWLMDPLYAAGRR